jgi:adenylate cyclase
VTAPLALAFALSLARGAPASAPPPIRLVVIDQKTQRKFGPLPWPRDRLAAMVRRLTTAKARAIVLRFYFRDTHHDPGDRALVQAAAAHGHVFVEMGKAATPSGWQPHDLWLDQMTLKAAGGLPKDAVTDDLVQLPFEELGRAVRGIGSVDVIVDREGQLRSLPLAVRHKGRVFPSLALRVFLDVAGLEDEPLRLEIQRTRRWGLFSTDTGGRLRIGRRRVALDAMGCAFVNLSAPGAYAPLSFADVLGSAVPDRTFRDAVVIVGAETPALDVKTSTGAKSGLELVADQLTGLYALAERE